MIDRILMKIAEDKDINYLPELYVYNQNIIDNIYWSQSVFSENDIFNRLIKIFNELMDWKESRMLFNNKIFIEMCDLYFICCLRKSNINPSLTDTMIRDYKENQELLINYDTIKSVFNDSGFSSIILFDLPDHLIEKNFGVDDEFVEYVKQNYFKLGCIQYRERTFSRKVAEEKIALIDKLIEDYEVFRQQM